MKQYFKFSLSMFAHHGQVFGIFFIAKLSFSWGSFIITVENLTPCPATFCSFPPGNIVCRQNFLKSKYLIYIDLSLITDQELYGQATEETSLNASVFSLSFDLKTLTFKTGTRYLLVGGWGDFLYCTILC